MNIVELNGVWEMYRIKFVIDGKPSWDNFWALRDISLNVAKGESLGIIGENGAGKSTILKLIYGMLKPDRGDIGVSGRVSGLLELGAGFQPELTGRENIYLTAGMYGLSQSETAAVCEEIVTFADIGKFINAPVECYSQGMFVRLAFAIAIHMKPDILLIDDTLAVGDGHFQKKCLQKVFELKESGVTIILVTHDMEMLRRLCQRVVLIKEGRIIKDDATEKVIPLYTRMAGHSTGVGVLQKDSLQAVFNNGRLFVSWDDALITAGSGVYANFSLNDQWYNSLQADWQVNLKDETRMLATGKFYRLGFTQTWEIEITKDHQLKLGIEVFSDEPVEIQEGYLNFMARTEYANWFTVLNKGAFPEIKEGDRDWQGFLEGPLFSRCIGLSAQGSSLPTVIFEHSGPAQYTYPQILNSDYLTNCRILQYKKYGLRNYISGKGSRFTYFAGQIKFGISDINRYLQELERESVLSSGDLRLIVYAGRIAINYRGRTLTSKDHIFSSIHVNNSWYASHLASCEAESAGEGKLTVKYRWRNLPLCQIWEIGLASDNTLSIKIRLRVEEALEIDEQMVFFLFSKEYLSWFSDYAEGKFNQEFLEVDTDVFPRCISDGEIGLAGSNNMLPSVSLAFSGAENTFAKIFNSDFHRKSRILTIGSVYPEGKIKFPPGEYECLKAVLSFGRQRESGAPDSPCILIKDSGRFAFDAGSGHIYWQEIELTKRLGLYTSLRSGGRWHDSFSSAVWKAVESNQQHIRAIGRWRHLPIMQHWVIALQEEGCLDFTVKLQALEPFGADRFQANVMLSEGYSVWTAGNRKGSFPEFKKDIDDDWESIDPGPGDFQYIGVSTDGPSGFLKEVYLSPHSCLPGWELKIINSDIFHRARVLQCLKKQEAVIDRGEHDFFSGRIFINRKVS